MSAVASPAATASPLLRLARSRAVRQTGLFTASTLAVGLLSVAAKAVIARTLSPAEFGGFAFATSFLLLAAMVFEFGLFLPAARAMARATSSHARELVGTASTLYLPVGAVFALTVLGASFAVDGWFNVQAGDALRVTAAVAFAYPLGQVVLWLAQGADRLHLYSLSAAGGQALFAGTLAALVAAGVALSLPLALTLQGAALLAGWLAVVAFLRPRFHRFAERAGELVRDARAYGLNAYVGRILSIGTFNMDVLLVAAFADARTVAVYAVAVAVARVVGIPSTGLASTLFARLAHEGRVERRWLGASWGLGLAAAAVLVLVGDALTRGIFGDAYAPGILLLVPLAFGEAIRGVTTLYNSSLTAQAEGRALRNAGLVLTASNLVLCFTLIPRYGAVGAAFASLGALAVNLVVHGALYRRTVLSRATGTPAERARAASPAG